MHNSLFALQPRFLLNLSLAALVQTSAWAADTVETHVGKHVKTPVQTNVAMSTAYICPMHPHVHQDHPGACPICGMGLVLSKPAQGVQIDSVTQQKLGVRLTQAVNKRLSQPVHTFGTVGVDESRLTNVATKYDGWIQKLGVNAVGGTVKAGQLLYEIYSPDLMQRQREHLKLIDRRTQLLKLVPSSGTQENELVLNLLAEYNKSRLRFIYEGWSAQTITEMEDRRQALESVPIYATRSGTVLQIGAREGSFVSANTNILSISDLTRVWIDIALYEDQMRWVRDGDEVTVATGDIDFPELIGKLKIASLLVDPATRTLRGRLEIANPQQRLRPGAYVDITVQGGARNTLAIPKTAVLRNGKGNFVMRHTGSGHFSPTAVHTGIESTFWVEIKTGLANGDEVAANGQFLLAAEASLQDSLNRMQAGTPTLPAVHTATAQ
ncbi:MAG: efflux RND transporter periplasmic adaptor subunit [Gammaproteobacteria bacterium]|nr:efflux RND transporter periplasmic adaptor subunit [Gammaproteobacteria bacterium]